MLRLRGHTQFLLFGLSLHGLQVQYRRRAPHIEEVLAHPPVARPPTLAGPQRGQARLHLHPLAQLRPQGTPMTLRGGELHHRPETKGFRVAPGTGNRVGPQIELEVRLAEHLSLGHPPTADRSPPRRP